MCGSGTIVIEAALWANQKSGHFERDFAFKDLPSFNPKQFQTLNLPDANPCKTKFYGFDRNAGAISNATANAKRASIHVACQFTQGAISDLQRPEGPTGLVLFNPPYGARISNKAGLYALYQTMGSVLMSRFSGWRVGFVTTDQGLAKASKLPLLPPSRPISHGGLKIRLFQTKPLP